MTDAEKLRHAVEEGTFVGDVGPLLVAEVRRLRDTNRRLNRRCQAAEHFAAVFRRESENLRGLGPFVAWYQRMVAETRRRVERCREDFERGATAADESAAEIARLRIEVAGLRRQNAIMAGRLDGRGI